jgi:hypothetical protein
MTAWITNKVYSICDFKGLLTHSVNRNSNIVFFSVSGYTIRGWGNDRHFRGFLRLKLQKTSKNKDDLYNTWVLGDAKMNMKERPIENIWYNRSVTVSERVDQGFEFNGMILACET